MLNEETNPYSRHSNARSCLISKAIANDKQLQVLHAKKVEIYSWAIPTVILGKDGKAEVVWIDEINHPLLPKVNEMIKERIEQIKQCLGG